MFAFVGSGGEVREQESRQKSPWFSQNVTATYKSYKYSMKEKVIMMKYAPINAEVTGSNQAQGHRGGGGDDEGTTFIRLPSPLSLSLSAFIPPSITSPQRPSFL